MLADLTLFGFVFLTCSLCSAAAAGAARDAGRLRFAVKRLAVRGRQSTLAFWPGPAGRHGRQGTADEHRRAIAPYATVFDGLPYKVVAGRLSCTAESSAGLYY